MSVELVQVNRGQHVESIHRGDIVAVDANGNIIFSYGDPYKSTFWRSSAKPFQVMPFIEQNGLEIHNITNNELAIMTASHGGEAKHVALIQHLLNKINKTEEDLDCGSSSPMYGPYAKEMIRQNIPYGPCNNPCSGKHVSMLAFGDLMGYDLKDYIQPDHPIQQKMHQTISFYTEVPEKELDIAIDGCGVPVFYLPIYNMALAYVKLACDPKLAVIKNAMVSSPFYVAGTNRLDTIIMEESQGRILAKLGAESVYCMTLLNEKVSIALKIEDGSYRALDQLVPDLLFAKNFITQDEYDNILKRIDTKLYNHRREIVGYLETHL